jgi:hypothetical protein
MRLLVPKRAKKRLPSPDGLIDPLLRIPDQLLFTPVGRFHALNNLLRRQPLPVLQPNPLISKSPSLPQIMGDPKNEFPLLSCPLLQEFRHYLLRP